MSQNELQRVVADVIWRIDNEADQFIDKNGMEYLKYLRGLLSIEAAQAIAPGGGDAFEKAMKASWQMVAPNPTWAAGSYYAGQNNGMIAALQTVRENYNRELAAMLAAAPASEPVGEREGMFVANTDGVELPIRKRDDGKWELDPRYANYAKPAASSAVGQRKEIIGYGDCNCILPQYCAGDCNPIYDYVPAASSAVGEAGQ